ncbi:MAG: rane fusion protein multidrug efflux system [Hyphomicrobiales bacterium]|nr:rane fusion protein multidrug efflux system [Hyphomicrobiales bacterium]
MWKWYPTQSAVAQAPAPGNRSVPVEVAQAVGKLVPLQVDALGNVTPIASVAIKSRLDNEIVEVKFADGARVKKGDVLLQLDTRALDAQIRQAQGNLARDRAMLEGAERDFRRYTELVSKGATPVTNLDNARTQSDSFRAAIQADQAVLDNLRVQLTYSTITAAISGRISAAAVKVGNFVRSADTTPIATINQISPIYVSFAVPQRYLPDLRKAISAESATIEATIPGSDNHASGAVSMIENSVDTATGMATIRATMPNEDELLWPGTLVNVRLTLRQEQSVVVPSPALQVSQQGTFVFVVVNNVAQVRSVKVGRIVGGETVIESGLKDGETVVTNGHLLLTNGAQVTIRKAGA